MQYFADLHIHSRYARATSRSLNLEVLDNAARQKGVKLLGTGDFTHPMWLAELREQLVPAPEAGLYIRRDAGDQDATRFMLSVEIASIYQQGGKGRRIHTLIMLPSLEAAADFNHRLSDRGARLSSDGRPIVGLSVKMLASVAFSSHPDALVIPAHAWTPWFGILGSMSGFDSLEDCFEELTPQILAIETGLSSDPAMNWRLSALDQVALISSSDAHSAAKIGREATQFEGKLSFDGIRTALAQAAPAAKETAEAPTRLVGTLEFFPEEGKYHFDGHRDHAVRWSPAETAAHEGRCSVCGRPVTVGVLSRVETLADRPAGFKPPGAPAYRSLVPLEEIVAEACGASVGTKQVRQLYDQLVQAGGNELNVLLNLTIDEIAAASTPRLAEGVKRVRAGQLQIEPGYDGQFGTVHVFDESDSAPAESNQASLF